MRTARIFLSNGTNYATSINGTNTEIQKYFAIGTVLNVGGKYNEDGDPLDNLQTVEALTIEN